LIPGKGTVIDTAVVEVQGDKIFDFYMIPLRGHDSWGSTSRPVLYKSVYNTTDINKD